MAEALSELREEVAELRVALAEARAEAEAAKRVATAEIEAMREQLDAGIAARDMVIAGLKDTVAHERARVERLESAHAAEVAALRVLAERLHKMLAEVKAEPPPPKDEAVTPQPRRPWWRRWFAS